VTLLEQRQSLPVTLLEHRQSLPVTLLEVVLSLAEDGSVRVGAGADDDGFLLYCLRALLTISRVSQQYTLCCFLINPSMAPRFGFSVLGSI
jgi:hypothetical protein